MTLARLSFPTLVVLLLAIPGFAANEPALVQPRAVKLKGTQLKLSEVVRVLGEQTGITVQVAEQLGDPEIAVDWDGITFWQAVDQLAAKVHGRPYLYQRDGKLRLVKASGETSAFVSHDGVFRVALRRLTAVNDFESGGRQLTAALEVAWEPNLLPIYLDTRPLKLTLQDSAGKALTLKESGSLLVPVDNRLAMQVDVPLVAVDRRETKLALLQGQFTIRAPGKMQTFTLGNLKELSQAKLPFVKKEEEATCSILEIKLARTRWTIELEHKLPEGGPTFESFQSWIVHNELYLVNTRERVRLATTGSELIDSTSRKARVSYTFEGLKGQAPGKPEDLLLVYRAPASIIEVPVRFQFKDIPLP